MCQPNIRVGAFAIADAVNKVLLMLRIGVSTVLLLHHPAARGEDLPTATVAAEHHVVFCAVKLDARGALRPVRELVAGTNLAVDFAHGIGKV